MNERERAVAVRRIAREADPDRAIAALFAPSKVRDDLFALIAFNAELARIADQVSEPELGAIRLQWWRDALERAQTGEATGHPVADAFGGVLGRRALSRERIAALIDARFFDIGETVMADTASLNAYLSDTTGSLFALTADIAAAGVVDAASGRRDVIVEKSARAYGLVDVMCDVPRLAARGRTYLPADGLARHGTAPDTVFAGETTPGLLALLAEMRDDARDALHEAVLELKETGPDAVGRVSFLPLALVAPYLKALAKVEDPLRQAARINPLVRLWRLLRFP